MTPVRRHRIGNQMPAVVHLGPDPAAVALCRDLVAETDAEAVILFGSRATGGWDEQSDLDAIIIDQGASDGGEERSTILDFLWQLRERHYPGYRDYHNPHHGVVDGQMAKSPGEYAAGRCTLNHVMARAAREGRIFTGDPSAADGFRHDGDVSNEWELVTKERLREAREANCGLAGLSLMWRHRPLTGTVVTTTAGRNAHGLLWHSGAALLSILGVIYPRDSVVEMATAIAHHDAGWSHRFRSDLARIDQYSGCGCEVVVTDPIDDVPAMWRDLEADRNTLWERIRELSGYDPAEAQGRSGGKHPTA